MNWEESKLIAREGGEDWGSSITVNYWTVEKMKIEMNVIILEKSKKKMMISEFLTLEWIHHSQLSNWGGKKCGIPWSCHNWLCDSSLLICWILYSSDGKGSLIWTPRRYPGSLAWNADFLRRTFHRYIRVSIIHTNNQS